MKILFIADFFKDQLPGGGESNDSNLISYLRSKNFLVTCKNCQDVSADEFSKYNKVIVGNFVSLTANNRDALIKNKNYIIYEHDHKYISTRDPSKYFNFQPPQKDIINKKFYENAEYVVVLSEICKRILKYAIPKANVHNIGCSLWSHDKLNLIEGLSRTQKNNKFAIIESSNRIKGFQQAVELCKKNNIEFEIIKPCSEVELLNRLCEFKGLVFLPQVLETFSRISMEAKMLGLSLLTKPKLIGAASELELFKLNGEQAIAAIRERNKKALNFFENAIRKNCSLDNDITVILNCYRRPEYLEEQIASLRGQSVKPKEIWIWVNYHDDNKNIDFDSFNVDKVIKNDHNWKFYGRFSAALLVKTKYVALFDDDTIPGCRWFENCINTMVTHPGILGGVGVKLREDRYFGHLRTGWSNPNQDVEQVDLVGHAWFMERSSVIDLWRELPYCWDNGEDIQLSYLAQKYSGTKTYVPPHPPDDLELFSSIKGLQYGVDEKATSRPTNHQVFYSQRDLCVKNAIQNGWKPLFKE